MTTAHLLYLGVTDPVRGFYFNPNTNVNANHVDLDFEYMYDISGAGYFKITGTVAAAFAVAEVGTGSSSLATGTVVYSDDSTYIIVKSTAKHFALAENVGGSATGSLTTITAIEPVAPGTGYFTDVSTDSDLTDSTGTLAIPGLYSFVLPSVVRGALVGISGEPLYWYRFAPTGTLSNTVDIVDIIPACGTVNYGYEPGAVVQQFSLNCTQCGAFEFAHTGTETLNIDWIQH
jgi:hypothetical protein